MGFVVQKTRVFIKSKATKKSPSPSPHHLLLLLLLITSSSYFTPSPSPLRFPAFTKCVKDLYPHKTSYHL
jgi:hypothetical protein